MAFTAAMIAEDPSDRLTVVSYGGISAYSAWSVRTRGYTRSVTPTNVHSASRLTSPPPSHGRDAAHSAHSPPGSPSPLMLASPFAESVSIGYPQGHGSSARPDVPTDVASDKSVMFGGGGVERSGSPGKALSLSTSFFSDGQSGKYPSPTAEWPPVQVVG